MLDPKIIDFLKDLDKHNDREWFNEHKEQYTEARLLFEDYVNRLIGQISTFDKPIGMVTAKECVFRIYRDVRFSKDKRPYKNNMGAYMSQGGRKSIYAGYYIHVQPGESFVGGGVYMPQPDALKKIREEIYYNVEEFINILSNKSFRKHFTELYDHDKLKNPPKGFDKEWPDIELLKHKSFTVIQRLDDKKLASPGLMKDILATFKAQKTLNDFLNRALFF